MSKHRILTGALTEGTAARASPGYEMISLGGGVPGAKAVISGCETGGKAFPPVGAEQASRD